MAKIDRKKALIFGSLAGGDQIAVFGSKFAGSPDFTTDPDEVQSLGNFLTGWYAAAIGGNAPAIQDMNALFFVLYYQAAYLMQQGVAEWSATTTYYTGSLALGTDDILYQSLQDDNLNQALTVSGFWKPYGCGVRNISSGNVLASDQYVRGNTTAGDVSSNLPALDDIPLGKEITLKNIGTGGNDWTLSAVGSDLIDGSASLVLESSTTKDSVTLKKGSATSWDII